MNYVKNGFLFAIGFFGTLGIISLGYSAYVTAFPSTVATGTPISSLEWNKMVQALKDLDTGVQQSACEARRGVWSSGTCQEYAYYTSSFCQYGSCTCNAGYHKCTFVDMFSGGMASLRRPGLNAGYVWVAGTYGSAQDSFFYPWGNGTGLQCNAGTHYMMDMNRGAAGNTAWGCYVDTYANAVGACCKDNQ